MLGVNALKAGCRVDGAGSENELGGTRVEEPEELGNLGDHVGGQRLEVDRGGEVLQEHLDEQKSAPHDPVLLVVHLGLLNADRLNNARRATGRATGRSVLLAVPVALPVALPVACSSLRHNRPPAAKPVDASLPPLRDVALVPLLPVQRGHEGLEVLFVLRLDEGLRLGEEGAPESPGFGAAAVGLDGESEGESRVPEPLHLGKGYEGVGVLPDTEKLGDRTVGELGGGGEGGSGSGGRSRGSANGIGRGGDGKSASLENKRTWVREKGMS